MEAVMYKCLVTGTLAVAAVALLASNPAQAGASASAASKYGHSSQVATTQHVRSDRLARNRDVAITEYSSSSAKNPPRGHGYR
jgi:hypothetical protein